jgi:hypothetical protein
VDDEFKLAGDTQRNLEQLAAAPGEVRFRMALVYALKDLKRDMGLMHTENRNRLDKIEKNQLAYRDVAKIAKTEIMDDKGIAQLKVDVKRLWTAGAWVLTAVGAAVLGYLLKALH